MGFYPWEQEELAERVKASGKAERVKMIYIETPANPTNTLIDIRACAALAQALSTDERRVLLAVDNTYMGPLWQHPLKLGADLVLYSATKYIGGHSDVIAGACLGS
ncbi:MAG: PLP-dependent transferase, partial [Flavobacteriales bacterium]|nr:PLP-dependent transferase [Flavobacteriales bacterium]